MIHNSVFGEMDEAKEKMKTHIKESIKERPLLNRNDQASMNKACCITGNKTCQCFHFCTLSGDQIDSIFS